MAYGSSPRPSGGLDLWAWLFMRVSGLVLLGLALGHLVIMHLIHNVDGIDYNFVAGRYAGWFWRGYDLAMLWLAMLHGVSGMKVIVDDYAHRAALRRFFLALLVVIGGGFLIMGTWVIVAFQPIGPVVR